MTVFKTLLISALLFLSLAAYAQPANDDCAGATLLTVNATCQNTLTDNTNATNSGAPAPTCGFFQGSDVWYEFVVPVSGQFRVEVNGVSGFNPQFALYSGSCGTLTQYSCNQLDPAITVNDATLSGQTMYARVHPFNSSGFGSFNICVWEPTVPANDNCASATPLTVGASCTLAGYTNAYATGQATAIAANPTCGFYRGGDVWFSFTMPASGNVRIEKVNGTANIQFALYSGSCGAFTQLLCAQLDDDKTYANAALAGQTLYLRMYTYNSEEGGTFQLCVWEPTVPANDNCASATPLAVGASCSLGNYTNAYAFSEPTTVAADPTCGFYRGGDVWFNFTMPASGNVRIEKVNGTANIQFALYSGSCGAFTELVCAQLDDNKTYVNAALAGQTLYLRMFTYGSEEGGTFQLCVWEPIVPANDNCANAQLLSVGTSCSLAGYSALYASAENVSVAANPTCGFYRGGDVWFTLEMPATGVLTINRTNTIGDLQFALYSGTCGAFTEISCAQLTNTMNVAQPSLAGETLYLRIYGYNNEEGGTFQLCAFDPSCLIDITGVNTTNASCSNVSDGSITVNATCYNCTGSIEYSIDNGNNYQSSNVFTGLAPGLYTVVARDDANNACVGSYGALILGSDALATTYYFDNDLDGYGDNATTQATCGSAPAGYVAIGGDCDDNNDAVFPTATEICGNSIDDNCNGNVDESCGSIQWTGNTSTQWNETGNWNGGIVPIPGDDIDIPNGRPRYPEIELYAEVGDITIGSAATVTILGGQSLTVAGTLTNNGTLTVLSGGSLVQETGSTLAGVGSYTVQRAVDAGQRFIGSPINNHSVSGFGISPSGSNGGQILPVTNALYRCNADSIDINSPYGNILELREDASVIDNCAQSLWHVKSSGNLTNARGYAINATSGTTLAFTGTVNNDTETYGPLGRQAGTLDQWNGNNTTTRGWHLVSNPYPSPITFTNGSLGGDFDNQIQLFDGSSFVPFTLNGGPVTIAVGQGFQIRVATEGGSGTFSLNNAMRAAGNPTFYRQRASFSEYVDITLSNAQYTDKSTVYFVADATSTFDPQYDANRLFGAANIPLLYTVASNGEYLAYNALAPLAQGTTETVPLSVYDGAAPGAYTLSFDGVSTLNTTVMLEDLKLNTITTVTEGSSYNFTTQASDSRNRFLLHFNAEVATGISTLTAGQEVKLFPNPTTGITSLLLHPHHGFSKAIIVDVSGRIVQSYELDNNKTSEALHTAELNNGIYFIKLIGNSAQTLKLIKQ